MNTLPRHMPAYLLVLFFCQLVPYTQAGETAPPETAGKAAFSSQTVSPPVAAGTEQPPPQLVLSLGNAVAMAVYRNIDLRIDALNFKMAEIDTAKSWGMYNPVFNASGSGGVTAVPGDPFFSSRNKNASIGLTQYLPTGGSISATTQTGFFSVDNTATVSKDWQSTAGVNITLPLLKNAGLETVGLNITLSANTQQDSLERFRATTIEMVSNVINSYNHLYVLRQAQETRVAALNSVQKLLDEIRKKAAPGAVQGLELANAEFAVAQRRKDLVDAFRSVKDQEVGLRYLIGLDMPTRIIPSDPPSRYEPRETGEQAVKAALEHRSDLKQQQLSLKTTQLQERVARRQSWPELSVNAGGGLTGSGVNFGESYQQIGNHSGTFWNVGMLFSVPLGNTAAGNEYRKSRIRTEQVQDQIRALSWRIRNDIEFDMRALISARLQMQLSDSSNQLAEQRLEEYRRNNQLGSATIQDVLNAENDRNSAHNALLEAVETFSNAVTKLWKDTGLLLDRHGIHIDTSHPDKLTESKEQNPALLVDSFASGSPPSVAGQEQTQNRTIVPALSAAAAPGVAAQKPAIGSTKKATRGMKKPTLAVNAPVPAAPPRYTLAIGEYGVKSAMADAIKRIKRAGLVPLVKPGSTKTEAMIRLYVADYPDQKSALLEVGRLRRLKVDGFIITGKEGKFTVYAGSYHGQKQSGIEQERLAAHGVKTVLKDASIPLATFLLTAGSFATREAAVKNASKLEKQGLKAAITENAD
ncbi:MAG: hypothetical protein PVSMB11_05430 [Desulfuromonadaceae bacterium]